MRADRLPFRKWCVEHDCYIFIRLIDEQPIRPATRKTNGATLSVIPKLPMPTQVQTGDDSFASHPTHSPPVLRHAKSNEARQVSLSPDGPLNHFLIK